MRSKGPIILLLVLLALSVQIAGADEATVITNAGPDEWTVCTFGTCEHFDGVISQTYIWTPEGYHFRGLLRGSYEQYLEDTGEIIFHQEFRDVNLGAVFLPNNSVNVLVRQFEITQDGDTCIYDVRIHFANGEYQFNETNVVCESI